MNAMKSSRPDKFILVIEDDAVLNGLIVDQLKRAGYKAKGVNTWSDAQQLLSSEEPHLILMDIRLPDGDGMKLLPELTSQYPVLVLTAHGSVRAAVQAIKAGAAEYLIKPIDLDELDLMVERTLATAALRRDHQYWKSQGKAKHVNAMVGSSPAMSKLQETIGLVAPSEMTVLIMGESGTGKELVAQAIHEQSRLADQNFVTVDCCSLHEQLFESELFGHEKGAFTGAHQRKLGLIEAAEGGTLFLDEIGEIDPVIQAKLLRVLDTGQFRRVGGTKDLRATVRIIAATNRDLGEMVDDERFRNDLYYRLSAFVIRMPPLRERLSDVPVLTEHFLRTYRYSNRKAKKASQAAIQQLVSYSWPGNIRELRNVVERAIILSGDDRLIEPVHLGLAPPSEEPGAFTTLQFETDPTLETITGVYLDQLLRKYNGHRATVAKIMGISERNLYRLIQRHHLNEHHPVQH